MARYIDAEKMLVTAVKDKKFIFTKEDALKDEVVVKTVYGDLAEFINSQPTADVVEVVRCKECKHGEVSIISRTIDGEERKACYCNLGNKVTSVDWYCPSGERSDT